ncbi:MAG: hypothetical protein PVG38_08900 [Gammaproteobacteria bacterium]
MKRRIFAAFLLSALMLLPPAGAVQADERFKPYVLASRGPGDFDTKVQATRRALEGAGFQILGEYTPYEDTFVDKAHVIVATNDELKKIARMSQYGGFAAPWRIGVTKIGDDLQISYANPVYIANAYRLESDLQEVSQALEEALGAESTFGSDKGLTERKLRKYHYIFGMEYFDNPYELAEYDSHKEAVEAIEKNLAQGVAGVTKVYRLDLSDNVTVFGVARKAPTKAELDMDDARIMEDVDAGELKGTAYLPYEIMAYGNKVIALHMRFRLTVHFPDLKLVGAHSFMGIMPSPGAVQKALTAAAGGGQ